MSSPESTQQNQIHRAKLSPHRQVAESPQLVTVSTRLVSLPLVHVRRLLILLATLPRDPFSTLHLAVLVVRSRFQVPLCPATPVSGKDSGGPVLLYTVRSKLH